MNIYTYIYIHTCEIENGNAEEVDGKGPLAETWGPLAETWGIKGVGN
jgi:hypothetical protein